MVKRKLVLTIAIFVLCADVVSAGAARRFRPGGGDGRVSERLGFTHKEGEGLLELGDLLFSKGIGLGQEEQG